MFVMRDEEEARVIYFLPTAPNIDHVIDISFFLVLIVVNVVASISTPSSSSLRQLELHQ
jgi:hypothetical protein